MPEWPLLPTFYCSYCWLWANFGHCIDDQNLSIITEKTNEIQWVHIGIFEQVPGIWLFYCNYSNYFHYPLLLWLQKCYSMKEYWNQENWASAFYQNVPGLPFLFRSGIAFHIETSHVCFFCMKPNTGLKWVKQ